MYHQSRFHIRMYSQPHPEKRLQNKYPMYCQDVLSLKLHMQNQMKKQQQEK